MISVSFQHCPNLSSSKAYSSLNFSSVVITKPRKIPYHQSPCRTEPNPGFTGPASMSLREDIDEITTFLGNKTNPVVASPSSTPSPPKQLESDETDDVDIQDQIRPEHHVIYQLHPTNRLSTRGNKFSQSFNPPTRVKPSNSSTGPSGKLRRVVHIASETNSETHVQSQRCVSVGGFIWGR